MFSSRSIALILTLGLLGGVLSPLTPLALRHAAADDAAPATGDILKQWTSAITQRDEIVKEIQSILAQAQKADDKQREQLFPAFQKLQQQLYTQVQPQIVKLAPQIFAKDPQNAEAAKVVMALAYEANEYAKVIRLGETLMKAPKPDPLVFNLVGISHFALMDLDRAQTVLAEAAKAEPRVFAQLGSRFAEAIPAYIDYWKQEQALRAREAKANDLPRVLMKTTRGEIEIELFENEAPNTVANFISLVEKGFYDGLLFHRVLPNFMAQGGDPDGAKEDPTGELPHGPGYSIACECYQPNARKHFQGSLSMAHAGKDSGGSQFFLTHLPTTHLNANAAEQKGHTVFGRIVKGIDVALALQKGDKIESVKVLRKRNHKYEPEKTADRKREDGVPRIRLDKRPAKKAPQGDE